MKIFNFLLETALNEGLIKTQGAYATKSIIERNHKLVRVLYVDDDETVLGLEIRLKVLKPGELDSILKLVNNLGWFPSIYITNVSGEKTKFVDNNKFKEDVKDAGIVSIKLEKKFDPVRKTTHGSDYFHVARQKVLPKIEKNGLVPRSKSKIGFHPERIYLARGYNKALEILEMLYQHDESEPLWVMFQVDITKVPNIELRNDPNFEGGVYTLQNIPPSALKVVKKFDMSK